MTGVQTCALPIFLIAEEGGGIKYSNNLTKKQFEILVEVDDWKPGRYIIKLVDFGLDLVQTSFIIEGTEQSFTNYQEDGTNCPIVKVHPNPSNGLVTINVVSCNGDTAFSYDVFSPDGVKLHTGSGIESKQVSLQSLKSGVYILVVAVGKTQYSFTIMLK